MKAEAQKYIKAIVRADSKANVEKTLDAEAETDVKAMVRECLETKTTTEGGAKKEEKAREEVMMGIESETVIEAYKNTAGRAEVNGKARVKARSGIEAKSGMEAADALIDAEKDDIETEVDAGVFEKAETMVEDNTTVNFEQLSDWRSEAEEDTKMTAGQGSQTETEVKQKQR